MGVCKTFANGLEFFFSIIPSPTSMGFSVAKSCHGAGSS
jgi:hypothetical protein